MPSLGNDLALIRKKQNLSLEDMQQATKIPLRILKAIEDDSIFTGMDENTTYIRSYVRSYAKAIKIEDNRIVKALDQMEEGTYEGLREKKTGRKTSSRQEEEHKKSKRPESPASDMVHDHSPGISSGKETPSPGGEHPGDSFPPGTPPPSVNSVDWADMGRKFTPLEKKSRVWVGLLVILGVLITAFIVIWYQYSSSPTEPSTQADRNKTTQQAVSPDSLQLNLANPGNNVTQQDTPANDRSAPAEALSDTLTLVIYAAYDKLEPVRVFTDVINSLNPYWIEHGEAFKFDFVNTIRFRGQYSRMELLLNGHVIPDFRQRFLSPQSGMVEINRSVFEGDPKWLQPPPDSLDINAPYPSIIKERPTFN